MMHVGLGRAHPLHVEYIHLGACLAFIQDILMEAILSHPRLPMPRKLALVKAISKVIWIQNDLMAKWHIHDGDEFKDPEKEVMVEKEGFLHGRSILGEEDKIDGAEMGAESPSTSINQETGTCPFQTISIGNIAQPK